MTQHPELERFKTLFQTKQYDEALQVADRLLVQHPNSAALHWHRATCLEQLDRLLEAALAVDLVLLWKPDYVPALLKRFSLAFIKRDNEAPEPDWLDVEELKSLSRQEVDSRQQAQAKFDAASAAMHTQMQDDLHRALRLEPNNAQALFLSSSFLQELSEAERLLRLDRAIALAPKQVEYLAERAQWLHRAATVQQEWDGDEEPPLDSHHVKTLLGLRYDRTQLDAARRDYQACWTMSGEYRYALKAASISHDLGEYDRALQHYDEAIAKLPADAPHRSFIVEQRARSLNNGAGEREQMANMVLGGLNPNEERNLSDDMAAQAIRGMAESIRQGKSMAEAVAANVSEDPDTMVAMNLARQILNVAHEPAPELELADALSYPAYQRKHCTQVAKEAQKLGLIKIADAEARGLFAMLGQHVLISIFTNQEGDIGLASFAMKPKWPGFLGFMVMLFTGKWKVHRMVECASQFTDGTCVSTQPESVSAFEYGGKVHLVKLPADATASQIYARHTKAVAKLRARNPQLLPMRVSDLAGVEARWVAGQQSKAEYRKSINYVTDSELKRILGGQYERFADKVRTHIRAMTS